jgi:SPASM domain peptide maturase of grasp-with-spasm system
LQKQKIDFIPNSLCEIIASNDVFSIDDIKAEYTSENHHVIDEYFDFLYKNDYIFNVSPDEYKAFPKIDLVWMRPEIITNAIFDIGLNTISNVDFCKVSEDLDLLGCKAIQFRFFDFTEFSNLEHLSNCFAHSRVKHIDFLLPYSESYESHIEYFEQLSQKYQRIQLITFYNSPIAFVKNTDKSYKIPIIFSKSNASSHMFCGKISNDDFYPNIYLFSEAQQHNTCLNRKISIDTEGYIRNCPSMPEHYGNIKDMTLQEAMKHPDFKKYWFVNKDQISVCKDCEFRYICTDCRAYRENPEDLYSKPLKCGYNPYTCEWEEWSTNPLKQKAIDYYGMREMVEK